MSYGMDIVYSLLTCLTCFQSPSLRVGKFTFSIIKLLGEGGFSYVYLVEATNGKKYALKKIRCMFGAESMANAMREVDAYKLFNSEYIIKPITSDIVQEKDGSRTVYIVLPYYPRGNLQDQINQHLIEGTHYKEDDLLHLFHETCKGVQAMHRHTVHGPTSRPNEGLSDDDDLLVTEGQGGLVGDDESEEFTGAISGTALGEIVAYAHRDIKPANIMIDNHDRPVLMDLGSTSRARVTLRTRHEALELQDMAAEHCTLPYRAPELFDVKTDSTIDEKVDIWSLGCTLFALMYNASPFELITAESGASLNLAIQSAKYKFPESPQYSDKLKDIVKACLQLNPSDRPSIEQLMDMSQ